METKEFNEEVDNFIEKKISECQKNGMIKFGFYEVSINQFFVIMDELKSSIIGSKEKT